MDDARHSRSPLDGAALAANLTWTRRLAARLVGEAGAEEVAQEVWLAAVRQRARIWPPTRGWLAGTARNLSARWWRDRGRQRDRERVCAREEEIDRLSAEELVARTEEQRRVAQAVLELEEPFRSTLLLRFPEDLSPAEIARRHRISEDTVRWRVRRGLALLRERFERVRGHDWRAGLLMLLPTSPPGAARATLSGAAATNSAGVLGGILVSTKTLAVVAALSALLIGMTLIPSDDSGELTPTTDATRADLALPLTGRTPAGEDSPPAEPTTGEGALAGRSAIATAASETGAECDVIGRVLDEGNRPLRGVRVHFAAEGQEATTTTDEGGRFHMVPGSVPVGSADLEVRPDLHHLVASFRFGTGADATHPPLTMGTIDLGEIRLDAAGALEGWVSAESGDAIPRPWLRMGTSDSLAYPHSGGAVEGDEEGRYLIGHLVPGEWTVSAMSYGFAVLETPVTIRAGATTRRDLGLGESPTISGRVVDLDDAPVEGATITTNSGYLFAWGARSEVDGAFRLALANEDPAELRCTLAGWETVESPAGPIPTGRDDVLFRLAPLSEMRFRVVDATTQEPIERFGLVPLLHAGREGDATRRTTSSTWPPLGDHPDGETVAYARPRIDAVRVSAAGYASVQRNAFPDRGERDLMTIPLDPCRPVTGRVTWNGRAVAGARVELGPMSYFVFPTVQEGGETRTQNAAEELRRLRGVVTFPFGPLIALDPDPPLWAFDPLRREKSEVQLTDAQGRFAFGVGNEGHYSRLRVDPPRRIEHASPLVLDDLHVHGPGGLDLGTLRLPRASSVRGRIVLAESGPVDRLALRLDGHIPGLTRTDAEGGFSFEGVAPGARILRFAGDERLVGGYASYSFHLREGEERELTVRIENAAACRITLTVVENGRPREDVAISLLPLTPETDEEELFLPELTDAAGRARGVLPLVGPCFAELRIDDVAVRLPAPLVDVHGPRVDERIELELGSMVLERVDGAAWPAAGSLRFTVRPRGDRRLERTVELTRHGESFHDPDGELASDAAGRPRLDLIPAGHGELVIERTAGPEREARVVPYEVRAGEVLVVTF